MEELRFIFSLKDNRGFRTASTADVLTHTRVPLFGGGEIMVLCFFALECMKLFTNNDDHRKILCRGWYLSGIG